MPPTLSVLPADGEGVISRTAKHMMADVLAEIPADKTLAFVTAVEVRNGKKILTAAFATRTESGWQAATWLQSNLKDDLAVGAVVKKTW